MGARVIGRACGELLLGNERSIFDFDIAQILSNWQDLSQLFGAKLVFDLNIIISLTVSGPP
jgi:hypothetical protein